ncbi:flagellar filament capping protein FliD [Neobacillus drentensis]|uniref:flagellar filament capping protein FliD n=1 Tax=Neobacillus drentensis TaxID=220684 RepID=UPI002FFE59FF
MIDSSNKLRVSGLASGMNTDEIVANLVKAQSSRLNKMQQTKITSTWKSDAYRDINKKVDEFRKSVEGLRLQTTFNKQTVTSSDARIEVSTAGTSNLSDFVISEATPAESAKPASVSFGSASASVGASGLTFKLNGKDINLDPNITFDQAIAKINEISTETNVKATNVGGSLVFTTLGTGLAQKIDIVGVTEPNSLKITNTTDPTTIVGTDAKAGTVTINGTQITVSSNKFTYQGVSFNLKEKIPANSNISVQVSSDTQGVFDSVKTFVDKYNELIVDLNGRLSEKRYREYPPLLDDQKKDMKDTDIKLWDEKAKSGVLTSDSTIRSFLTEMRNSLISTVQNSGSFSSLKDIGINFSSNYRDNGKLVLDEAKLKGVLQTNLEDVKKLFTTKEPATGSATTATDNNLHEKSGFGWRIYDRLKVTITQLGSLAGSPNSTVDTNSFMAKQIKSIDANIYREQDKINAYEQRLWKQFGAMEKALQQLNSQGSWLSQQLGM